MIEGHLQNLIGQALEKCTKDGTFKEPFDLRIELEAPKVAAHGDLATNVAMIIASKEGKKPREIAEAIVAHLPKNDDTIQKVSVAGPGFINFVINPARYLEQLHEVFEAGEKFGVLDRGKGKSVQVEFVSANPTGPLHIGHGRGAVFGDVLGNVLQSAGYDVTKEYYVNDAGNQIATLGRSVYYRILELDGKEVVFPEDCYQGEYIKDIARELRAKDHKTVAMLGEEDAIAHCGEYASKKILDEIKRDLAETGVIHDQYFHENALHTDAAVERSTLELKQKGFVFEKDGALWFNATAFGDDKDRVFKKSDGSYTYFAADIAYHKNKFDRGFDRVIDIWGADHGGYVPRMRAAVEAMGHQPDQFDVVLIQLVNLIREGKMVSMSTRAATYETLEDVRREVGKDVCRYFFLTRSHNAQLDFDLELAKKTTPENPVFYIQYAHARIASLFRKAEEQGIKFDPKAASLDKLDLPEEVNLSKLIAAYPDVIRECADTLEPHKLAFYLLELARAFQSYYSKGRDDPRYRMVSEDKPRAQAKLYLAKCVQIVLQNALKILGISAPERMDREVEE
jgi:arginyl-tRNA synthetase